MKALTPSSHPALHAAFQRHFAGAAVWVRDEGTHLTVRYRCAGRSDTQALMPSDDPDTFVLRCVELWEAWFDGQDDSGQSDQVWISGGSIWD